MEELLFGKKVLEKEFYNKINFITKKKFDKKSWQKNL